MRLVERETTAQPTARAAKTDLEVSVRGKVNSGRNCLRSTCCHGFLEMVCLAATGQDLRERRARAASKTDVVGS